MTIPDGRAMSSTRVVVFIQENKTTEFYFPTLVDWGADVRRGDALLKVPPDFDQPHDRSAWVHYKMGDYPAVDLQIDNDLLIPFYSWLAKEHTFCDHHFGAGSNSTPGHMLAVGGQMPTLKNPPFGAGGPEWDIPNIFSHAEASGVAWAAFPSADGYPTKFYKQLQTASARKHLYGAGDFVTLAETGKLPQLVYAWSPDGSDEHPPYRRSDPEYITRGHDLVWQRVDAVVRGGHWDDTVFVLTWDDWGGYTDHVATPDSETVPDALHPHGFQVIGGSRIPLVLFGGRVVQGIENSWHSHASIVKTIVDLLGLPPFGVPDVDHAPSLVGRVSPNARRAPPPSFGSAITQPSPPHPTRRPTPPPPWKCPQGVPMSPLVANGGVTIPVPTDGHVDVRPPASTRRE